MARGFTTRKRGQYYGVVELPRDPQTGKRRRRWLGGFATKRQAQDAITELLGKLNDRTYVEPSKRTLREYLEDEWLPGRKSLRASTRSLYATVIRAYIGPRVGEERLDKLTPGQVAALYDELGREGGRDGGPLSNRTVRQVHAVLRKALDDAMRRGYVSRNVALLVEAPRNHGAEMQTWTSEQLSVFLEHVRGDRLYAAWRLIATTGMRRGELLGLRWSDTDLEAGRIRVRQTRIIVDGHPALSEPKTDKGRRSIPIPPQAVTVLRAHRMAQMEERAEFGPGYGEAGLVFTREDGEPIHPERFADAFERHTKAAGLPSIRVHDLRHTFATLALESGVPAKVVSEILGHASIVVTLDLYSHVSPSMAEDATARVESLLR